ncbi:MAG: type II secretion system protein M [Gammaproteobacteria bacterium]|nr:type II secretion system protein M [Gammaproteobacteria bacterium]
MSAVKDWYAGLNQREKLMVNILGIAFALLMLSLLVIVPIKEYRAGLIDDRDALKGQVSSLKTQVATLQAGGVRTTSNQPLNQLINQSANQFGLKLSNIQERKRNQEIQLRLDDVEFDQLIRWVSNLEQAKGLIVENFRVSKTDVTGKVDVSLKVLRAG